MFLLIDNYDSFTYNLVQAFYALGKKPVVVKNDDPDLLGLAARRDLEMVCISPGPSNPENAGQCLNFLAALKPSVPVLGVCLGHEILGVFGGAEIVVGPRIMHGKQSEIVHNGEGLFENVPNPMKVGRYHSLVIDDGEAAGSSRFTVTARGPEGEVMAIAYTDRPWVGVQFHPESVLTPDGLKLLANFPQAIIARADEDFAFATVLERLARKEDLSAGMSAASFSRLLDGEMTPAQAGSFLLALRMKGESPLELAHATRAALARSVRVDGIPEGCVDVADSGGDGRSAFNWDTISALVLAGLGYRVAHHGGRAARSPCGSVDAAEALGIRLDTDPSMVADTFRRSNFALLSAPDFNPAFRNTTAIRRELGIRTLLDLVCPMVNPARPGYLLLGLASPEFLRLAAETLLQAPISRAAVVCGAGGYGGATPIGPASVLLLHGGTVDEVLLDPEDFGIRICDPEDLAVHAREEAIDRFRELVSGRGPRPMLDMVTLNVGLALYLLEEEQGLAACMSRAEEAVRSGVGRKALYAA